MATACAPTGHSVASARWLEIVSKVESCFGSPLMAHAWYRFELLAGFSGATAIRPVEDGRVKDVVGRTSPPSMSASTPDVASSSVTYRAPLHRALNPLLCGKTRCPGTGAEPFGATLHHMRHTSPLRISRSHRRQRSAGPTRSPPFSRRYWSATRLTLDRVSDAREVSGMSRSNATLASTADPSWRDRRYGRRAPTHKLARE